MIRVYKKPGIDVITDLFQDCYVSYVETTDVNVTDYGKLKEFYRVNQIDYISFRNTLKTFDFANLNQSEKLNLINEFVAPSYEIMSQFKSNEELEVIYANMVSKEKQARIKRYEEITYIAGFILKENEMYQFMAYNDIKPYKLDYIEVEFPALLAFVTSSSIPELGIDFTSTGFSSKVYYSEELKNRVLQILTK